MHTTTSKKTPQATVRLGAVVSTVAILGALAFPMASQAQNAAIDVTNVTITFPNIAIVGEDARLNDSFVYDSVAVVNETTTNETTTIGARVTVKDVQNAVADGSDGTNCSDFRVARVDRLRTNGESNDPLRTNIKVCGGTVGFVELEVAFFVDNNGTEEPQPLRNLKANFEDVDNRQFLWVYGNSGFRLPGGTKLTVDTSQSGVTKFIGPAGSADPIEGAAEVTWNEASAITFRFGSDRSSRNSAGSANLVLDFVPAAFVSPEVDSGEPEAQGPAQSSARVIANPAIAITPLFGVGDRACSAEVLTNGEGLLSGSARSLNLSSQTLTLDSGVINGSSFESSVTLPETLPSGSHTLTLSAIGRDGTPLTLVRGFRVDSNCVVTEFSTVATNQLARTGANAVSIFAVIGLFGMALGLVLYRVAKRDSVPGRI